MTPEQQTELIAFLKENLTISVDRPRVKHPRADFYYYDNYRIEIWCAGELIAHADLPNFQENHDG